MNALYFLGFAFCAVCIDDAPPDGRQVLASEPLASAKVNGEPQWGKVVRVVPQQQRPQVLRIETHRRPPKQYNFQVRFLTEKPIARGDVLLLSFRARAVTKADETGDAVVGISVQGSTSPWPSTYNTNVHLTDQWREINLPFRSDLDLPAGGGQVCLQVGVDPQVIEVRDVALVDYGPEADVRGLPTTRFSYAGREPDAAWRIAAEQRIERYRKGQLIVHVVDGNRRPVQGADVTVNMTRHSFGWGSAVSAALLTDDTPDARRYRETVLSLYNRVVFENDLKWPQWERPMRRETTMQAIEWLRSHDIAIRGHCLVWPSWKRMPRDVEQLKDDLPALRQRVAGHITEEVTALRGKLVEFDVINEPYSNHDLMDLLGRDVMVEWFQLAHRADPQLKLYINDYNILTKGGRDREHQQHYEETIRYLLKQNAPLHGIGLQSHFDLDLTPPERVIRILDRFAQFGLPLQITEHDIDTTDEQLQADYTRDFLTAVFSHPAVVGVLTWGFWEGQHWKPNGAYFRRDWSIKPAGRVWQDLVQQRWWTRAHGRTDANGAYTVRGFLGDYNVVVKKGDITEQATVRLESNDTTQVTVVLGIQ